jgi:Ca2+-binding RTX toxin-like protein
MTNPTFQDARTLIAAAERGSWHLPAYEGGRNDLAYLRSYVTDGVARTYDVDPSVLQKATMFSTSLVRDFVHRAIYQSGNSTTYAELRAADPNFNSNVRSDVAAALRYPASDSCGLMGYQLFRVFEALGYDCERIGAVEGDLVGGVPGQFRMFSTGLNYSNAHVTTQVFVEDLGKFVIQDSTFNLLFTDESGVPLSMNELRLQQMSSNPTYSIAHDDSYRFYRELATSMFDTAPGRQTDYIRDVLLHPWSMQNYSWDTVSQRGATLVLVAPSAFSVDIAFSSQAAANNALQSAQAVGNGWVEGATSLRPDKFVSGFKTFSLDTGRVTGEWLTVVLENGEYVSRDRLSGRVLNGSYDQIVAEASGSGVLRNPGVDMSEFFSPIALLGRNGIVYFEHEAERFRTPLAEIPGTSGSNLLRSMAGRADLQDGGGGDDVYHVNDARDLVWEASGGGYDRVETSVSYALSSNTQIEYLAVADRAATAAINLTANRFTQIMAGNAGVNVFFGSESGQKMFGYGGNDTYYVNSRSDVVNETAGHGHDRIYTTSTYVLSLSHVEDLMVTNSTSTNAVNLVGNNLTNILTGNFGPNQIQGRLGADIMSGLKGDDSYVVNDGRSVIIEHAKEGRDTVFTTVNYQLTDGAHVEALRVASGIANATSITLLGNGLQSQLVGHNGRNTLNAQGGETVALFGLDGDDSYYVNRPGERIVEAIGKGFDRVFVTTSYTLGNGVEVELLATSHPSLSTALILIGNEFGQQIIGNAGANVLNGKGGIDTLTGGAGADTFIFDVPLGPSNVDTLTDFTAGVDHIELSGAIFGLAGSVLDAAAFHIGAAADDVDDRVIYDQMSGALSLDRDGNGATAPVPFAALNTNLPLSFEDFLIV